MDCRHPIDACRAAIKGGAATVSATETCENAGVSEAGPAAASAVVRGLAGKAGAKKPEKVLSSSKVRKPAGPSVTELIIKAVSASKERKGLSLAALKALAAGGYDVEKNNSRIELGLKSLFGKGTLVQTKGIGASGSFRLSKKPREVKEKAPKNRVVSAKPRKSAAKKTAGKAKKPKKVVIVKNPKKPAAAAAKKVAKSPKVTKAAKPKKTAAKSPAKAKVVKAKVTKPRGAKPKVAKSKAAAAKKK